ncbi:MAG: flagellar motor protein MotB [Chromatiales bacterium]|jgi:chemotaxis protein MotB
MKQSTHSFLSLLLLTSSGLSLASEETAGANSERIYFIQEDGRHAMVYTTSRSDFSTYSLWFGKQKDYTPEKYLEDFHYIYPNSRDWKSREHNEHMVLKLPQGDFASLKWVNLEDKGRLQVDEDGVYYYRSWNLDREAKSPEGHFGIWNSPGDFKKIACSWVFPKNLQPVNYLANRKGEWRQRHNTLTYYGRNVNDLFFAIEYRPTSRDAYKELKGLEGDGVEVEQQPTGVKMTVAETLLFPSGVATISNVGAVLLQRLAKSLKQQPSLNIVVAGHTDNVPIGVELEKRFPTNWELSSKRAINIIHYLVAQGVDETRFEAHAFSFMQPRASNEDEVGRAKNRRIEIMLTEAGQDTVTAQARLD